jgi:cell shape-determining protein MreC
LQLQHDRSNDKSCHNFTYIVKGIYKPFPEIYKQLAAAQYGKVLTVLTHAYLRNHRGREKTVMELFERLVNEQLKTMEQLLFLQSEIERCQEIKKQLIELQQEAKLQSIQEEIQQMKQQLKEIQQTFEKQTEEVILSYQNQYRRTCEPSSAW